MFRKSLLSAFLGLICFAISGQAAQAGQVASGPAPPDSLQASASRNFPAYVVYVRFRPDGHWVPSAPMSYPEALNSYEFWTRSGYPAFIERVN
jgi:hypothetical protein